MLIKPQKVEINIGNRNKKRLSELGYDIGGSTVFVNVEDLSSSCTVKIEYICDYCKQIKSKPYESYVKCTLNGKIKKDSCSNKKCMVEKSKESNLLIYGTESTNSLRTVINKKKDKLRTPFSEVQKEFVKRGYILLENIYLNSHTKMRFKCKVHMNNEPQLISYSHLKNGRGCRFCAIDNISGANHYLWKGGKTSLTTYLRDRLRDWTYNSLKKYHFKCVITGSTKDLEVHHTYNFSDIVDNTLTILDIDLRKSYHLYSKNELRLIEKVCRRLHYEIGGLGFPITKELHSEFHTVYGKKNNTHEQFEEFLQNNLINKT